MPALNFIPPTTAAASKKSGNGGWNVEDADSSPAHPPSSPHPAQSEIFQLVMDHLPGLRRAVVLPEDGSQMASSTQAGFFSGARPLAKAKTGQFASSEVPAQKKDEAGADAANGGNPPIAQTKSDFALSPDVLIPPANFAPIDDLRFTNDDLRVVNPSASQSQIVNRESQIVNSTGVGAVGFGRGKTNAGLRQAVARQPMSLDGFVPAKAGLTPAAPVLSTILGETDSGPAGPSAPASGAASGAEPAARSAKKCMDLPAALSPVAGGAPGTGTARPASEASHASPRGVMAMDANPSPDSSTPRGEAVPGVPLTSPEDSENEAAVAVSGGKMPEIQKEPATTEHLRFTNDDLRAANPSPSQSQIANRISQIVNSTDGTAVAQQDATMKMATKKTDFSGAKQKLPGVAAVATGENLPGRSERDAVPATIIIRVDPALPSGDGISTNAGAAKAILPETVNSIHFPPAVPQYVERTREMISLQVMHVQETGADEMRVVIKPDAGLQLSLHLQQRDGGVEVQAVLDRGNFGLLNRHWPELQQQLELRGVRVAPLANAEQSFGGGSEGFRQPTTSHGQHAGDDADAAEMPAVLLPGLPPATATASASTTSSRRLETWA